MPEIPFTPNRDMSGNRAKRMFTEYALIAAALVRHHAKPPKGAA